MPTKKKKNNKAAARAARPKASGNKREARPAQPKRDHVHRGLVVGLGASAGGLDAFQRFFRAMPADSGMTFVVIAHLDPRQKSALAEVLGRSSPMPVVAAAKPVRVEPDHVYVIAPDSTLRLKNGKLVPEPRREHNAPVDDLFMSLAEHCGPRAVCIVLSGTGTDGTQGIKAAKEAGGLTLAQASESAQYPGMPRSAVATGLVDLVLPVEQMPGKLLDYARRLEHFGDGQGDTALQRDMRDYLVNICTLLRSKTGHDFSQYKESTLLRRIQRRMQVVQLEKVASYVERLRKDGAEVEHLFQDLLIGVTHFFRDRDAFATLEAKVIPKLFENRVDDSIRVWVPGCATGEEAYSIAILLREHMRKVDVAPKIQIFATDIDEKALDVARAGIYPDVIVRDIPAARLKQFFVPRGDTYQVSKDVRELCVFSVHDLIKDPPFSRLDLISCRNLLIYMNGDLQNRVLPLFHFALRPGRFLFLGPSENVTQHSKFFTIVDGKYRMFRATAAVAPQLPALPLHGASDRNAPARAPSLGPKTTGQKALIAAVERTLIGTFMPAYVVINDHYDLIYSSSGTGKYLELPAGTPNANLINMARKGLRLELRAALAKALQAKRKIVQNDIVVGINGGAQPIRLIVQPLTVSDDAGSFFLVIFEDVGAAQPAQEARPASRKGTGESKLVQQLEVELRSTQERLQTTIEELETSNEELKSSNEEFQSMNEELQSANEELETSREELQSVNEELETVNSELTVKIESLDRANSDLKNLLESTQIATIFIDSHSRIKNFTPMAKDIFHLIESDIGRPITDIVTRLAYGTLQDDIGKVMRSLVPIESEVHLADGRTTFIMRILPYRTIDNVIDGVVMTFIDISERKTLEEERARLGNIVAYSLDAIIGISLDGMITAWNAGAERTFGYPLRESIGRRWTVLFPPDRTEEAAQLLDRAKRDEPARVSDTAMVASDGRVIPISLTVSGTRDLSGKVVGASLIARDIADRKQAEERQRLLLAELNHRVKNMLATVLSIANQTADDADTLTSFRKSFTGRIRSLSETQNLLTRTNWAGATMRDVLQAEAAPYIKQDGANFELNGPDLLLTPRAALSLALVVHELTTNALKYGALSRPAGRIAVSWNLGGAGSNRHLKLEWKETGGPKVKPPSRRGFGRRMIEEGLSYELGGNAELNFDPGGFNCTIEVSAGDAVADEQGRPSFEGR
jgi:two-component system CheB/CheR fusion protein